MTRIPGRSGGAESASCLLRKSADKAKCSGVWPHLDEHVRRLVAASQAVELGYGGISRVSRDCGLLRVTLLRGVEELQAAPLVPGFPATPIR